MRPVGDWLRSDPLRPPSVDASDAIRGLRRGRGNTASHQRKAKAKTSLQSFCNTYLKHHFPAEYGEHHLDLFAVVDAPAPPAGKRIVRVEPREHGKTTVISLAVPLYHLAYKEKRFILLLGEGGSVAKSNLSTLVTELEENELLLKDFPHLMPKRDGKNQIEKWTDEQIVVASGATVWAKGLGARMRGLKRGASRPDLAIVDDPESPETCASFTSRIRHRKWFGGTFLGLGSKGWDVYVISNLPHHDCLVAHLLRSAEWDGKLYRAINTPRREDERYPIGNTKTDGSALWPAVWPLMRLTKYRNDPTVGELGFAREMMGDPRDEKDKPFNSKEFASFDYLGPTTLQQYSRFSIFADPAGGEKPGETRKGRKDWACFVFGGYHKAEGYVDILDIVMTRKTLDKQCDQLLDLYELWSRLGAKGIRIGVEENVAKNLIGPELNKRARVRGLYPSITEQFQTHNKMIRILSTQPLIASGTVRWRKDLFTKHTEYFGQYDDYPGDHEDGPDATEGFIRMVEKPMGVGFPSGETKPSYWKGRVA